MQDGLYLNNTWVAEVDCALTFQANDLTKPDALTTSYSNAFTLPDTLAMRDLMQGAEQVDSGGPFPYRQLPAFLVDEGEVTFRGIAEFATFQGGWKVNLLDGFISFFDAIKDKPISDLKLDRYDHLWTLEQITSYANATSGVTYPFVDYGSIDGTTIAYDTICPGMFAKTLMGQIAMEAGYTLTGDWLNDDLLLRLILPFVGEEPKSHDEDWVEARSARVTADTAPIHLVNGSPINVILPFNIDNRPLVGYTDGSVDCYKADRYTYVCPTGMRVKVQSQVSFLSITRYGAAELSLILERNGQKVESVEWSEAGYYDHLDTGDFFQLDTSVDCQAGDELRIRLTGSSKTKLSSYGFFFLLSPDDSWASFIPDNAVHLGDTWPIAQNLPEMTCSDLFVTIGKAMSATYVVNNTRKTVRLVPLDDILKTIPQAQDWSGYVVENDEPELNVQVSPFAQKNWCRWKSHEQKDAVGYGDGFLSCDAPSYPLTVDLFELPFMAATVSDKVMAGYGSPPYIQTRTISGTGDNIQVGKKSAAPRLLLVEPSKTVVVQTKILSLDGTLTNVPVTLSPSWWAVRPTGAKTDDNNFSLAFSPVKGQTEQPLLARYFIALKRVLRRPRILSVPVYMQPSDVATLDLFRAVRIKQVRAGSLDLNDGYYIPTKLSPYYAAKTCTAILIAL